MPTARDAIGQANEGFMEAFRRGDTEAMARMYTDGAQLLPPGSDEVSGRSPIGEFWAGAKAMGLASVELRTAELEEHGDTAIEVGRYELRTEEDEVADRGKYLVVWKLDQGSWRLHRDIWNSSGPA